MRANNKTNRLLFNKILYTCFAVLVCSLSAACGSKGASNTNIASVEVSACKSGNRNNDIKVLHPVASGENVIGNDSILIDISNMSEGYIITNYTGESSKVKVQLSGNNQTTYTYNITPNLETVIPLSSDSGEYVITVFESIGNDQYVTNYSDSFSANITNVFGPFLYPNQYVNFDENSQAVLKSKEIVSEATCDLEAVGMIYDFVINSVTYDKEEAETVASNYLPDIDEVLATGKGICFDYAALMAAMLRSQGIPTRLEIGYAKDAYHAWISVYTEDEGWIGGVIKFDGKYWTLMDPTLASNSKDIKKIKDFIGDGSSYTVKYLY